MCFVCSVSVQRSIRAATMTCCFLMKEKRAERRLAIARRLFQSLGGKDRDRSITLCDSRGEVVVRHDPRPDTERPRTCGSEKKKSRSAGVWSRPIGTEAMSSDRGGVALSRTKTMLSLGNNPPNLGDVDIVG